MMSKLQLAEWHQAKWLSTGGFCKQTGLCHLVFELGDGSRTRLILTREDAKHIFETLRFELESHQRNITFPQSLISSGILQSAGSNAPGHRQEPPAPPDTDSEGAG